MNRNNYHNLEIYNRSLALACEISKVVDTIRPYRLGEQVISSSVSIPSNIAEGSVRKSNKDFVRFLEYSAGSMAELETQLKILKAQENSNLEKIDSWLLQLSDLSKMIHAFIAKKESKSFLLSLVSWFLSL